MFGDDVIFQVKSYGNNLKKVFGYTGDKSSGSELFRLTSRSFQAWIDSIFRQHNQQLELLFQEPATGNSNGDDARSTLNLRDVQWPI